MCMKVYIGATMICYILVTAGNISVTMDTTEELFRTDEEHMQRKNES